MGESWCTVRGVVEREGRGDVGQRESRTIRKETESRAEED